MVERLGIGVDVGLVWVGFQLGLELKLWLGLTPWLRLSHDHFPVF